MHVRFWLVILSGPRSHPSQVRACSAGTAVYLDQEICIKVPNRRYVNFHSTLSGEAPRQFGTKGWEYEGEEHGQGLVNVSGMPSVRRVGIRVR